jgi:hypothetical protein
MIKFREWLLEKQIKKDIEKSNELFCFFESFDTHYDITKTYENKSVNINFYEFRINKNAYRIFIENIDKFIHIGFEKQNPVIEMEWYIDGIDNDLQNGEIQKLFGTIIYVVRDLYKGDFNAIKVKTNEDKKFRVYLRLMQQISNRLLPESTVSHNDKEIHIYKLPRENVTKLKEINFKYKPKK